MICELQWFVNSSCTHKTLLYISRIVWHQQIHLGIPPQILTSTFSAEYIQDSLASTDSSRDSSPDVDEACSICCTCKSTCHRHNCPCKKDSLFCEDKYKCGTRPNQCKNQVSNDSAHVCNDTCTSLGTYRRQSYSNCCCFTGSSTV